LRLEIWLQYYGDYCNAYCPVTNAFDVIGIDIVVELCYLSLTGWVIRLQLSSPQVTVSDPRLYTVITIGFIGIGHL